MPGEAYDVIMIGVGAVGENVAECAVQDGYLRRPVPLIEWTI